jgi:protein-tyrosine phosphatase
VRFGLLFLLLACGMAAVVIVPRGYAMILAWPAAAFFAVGLAYLGAGPRVFGKRTDGTLAPSAVFLLWPYFLYTWGVWGLLRQFRQENSYDDLLPSLRIGRRLRAFEFPADIDVVVDLTSEFPEPRIIRQSHRYLLLPILDGATPSGAQLDWLLDELRLTDGRVYLHCAEGHGRTAMVASAALVARGLAADAKEAVRMVRAKRPRARMNSLQQAFLRHYLSEGTLRGDPRM